MAVMGVRVFGLVFKKCNIACKVFMEECPAVDRFIEGLVLTRELSLDLLVLAVSVKDVDITSRGFRGRV